MSSSGKIDGGAERARDIARLFLKGLVVVKVLMRGRIGLHVPDIAISLGHSAGRDIISMSVSQSAKKRRAVSAPTLSP